MQGPIMPTEMKYNRTLTDGAYYEVKISGS
jgi:hypothetical protein